MQNDTEAKMTDFDKYLNMLKSPKVSVRYDACEELRVATESSPEVIFALEEAAQDEDEYVAERARLALVADVHRPMARKMGRSWVISEMEAQAQTEQEPEQSALKINRLAIISLVLGIVGIFLTALVRVVTLSANGIPTFADSFLWDSHGLGWLLGRTISLLNFILGLAGVITGICATRPRMNKAEYGIYILGIVLGIMNCLLGGLYSLAWWLFFGHQ
jgi:hypothetical protein